MAKSKTDATDNETDTATGTEIQDGGVDFTTADGTTTAPVPSADGTVVPSSDSTTSPSPTEADNGPLGDKSSDAPGASKDATGSDDAPSTDDMLKALKGEHADGEGLTHAGTDTPEKLISNPFDFQKGEAVTAEDNHSDKPLGFDAYKENKEDDKKDA